jgi:hypothetical protein
LFALHCGRNKLTVSVLFCWLVDLLLGCVLTLFQLHMLCWMRWEDEQNWWVGKDLEGDSHGPYEVTSWHSPRGTGKPWDILVTIADSPDEIQTSHFYISLFSNIFCSPWLLTRRYKKRDVAVERVSTHILTGNDRLLIYNSPW